MFISKYTKYLDVEKDKGYITADYYGKDYTDEHPYKGYILSIAVNKNSRGSGLSDKLIKDAKKKLKDKPLIAEIDSSNLASKKLFERNGFKKS